MLAALFVLNRFGSQRSQRLGDVIEAGHVTRAQRILFLKVAEKGKVQYSFAKISFHEYEQSGFDPVSLFFSI